MNPQETMRALPAYTDQLMAESTPAAPVWNMEMIRAGGTNKWNYVDGCMMTAILSLHEITGEAKYLAFADAFLDWYVLPDGGIRTYDPLEYNLDNINPGKNLLTLHALTGKDKYLRAAARVRQQLDGMPRTKAGNFWHKQIYPWQVWLDGLYMAQPFYMRYEMEHNNGRGCADALGQFENVYHLLRRPDGLYCHGYDESRAMYWADRETGQSPNCWLRALGWFIAALVDTLELMDGAMRRDHPFLGQMLRELAGAILPWQHESGMFYQVIDRPDAEGNYLETSGTALIAYGLLKGARLGFLPASCAERAERAFFGTAERHLSAGPGGGDFLRNPLMAPDCSNQRRHHGKLRLGGICLVAGLGGADRRDGSLAYYFSEPVVENEAKGVAPLLLAHCEMLRREG